MTAPATGVAPGPAKVNVAEVIVAGFMVRLKVAEIVPLAVAAVAPFTGTVEMTVGGALVVKVQTKLAARGAPSGSFAPALIVAMYKAPVARVAVGVKVAEIPV